MTLTSRPRGRAAALLVFALTVAGAVLLSSPRDLFDDRNGAAEPVLRDTGTVEVSTLTTDFSAEGALAYATDVIAHVLAPPDQEIVTTVGAGRDITSQISLIPASTVVTELVPEGSIIDSGQVLWRLGETPTVALTGAVPFHRGLQEGDEGPDVAQLEAALVALGHDLDGAVTVDETFTAATAAMVERWQSSIGAEVDGVVHHGSVIAISGTSRVGDTTLTVGTTAVDGQVAFELLTPETQVTFTVTPADRNTLAIGDPVAVRTAARSFGAVILSSTVTEDGGAVVVARPTESIELAADEVPADVSWTLELAADVVTVPAEAIMRTDNARRWVEVRDALGVESWVEVEVGLAGNGRVEVTGNLEIGQVVIAP